jgi:hypothetical protein
MNDAPNLAATTSTASAVPMTPQPSRLPGLALWLGGLLLPALPAQSLAEQLAKGDARAIAAAAAALDAPSAEDVDALIRLIAAGRSNDGRRGIAGELAFAVLGWWSMQDAAIESGLYDRLEHGAWPAITVELVWLAAFGAGNEGPARARRWIDKDQAGWRQDGWWLLRKVGADAELIDGCIARALASDVEVERQLGMHLLWEFEVTSDDLRSKLESIHATTKDERTRWATRWAMVRTGSFRTAWLLDQRQALGGSADGEWFDRLFERMTPATATRLAGELPQLPAAQRARVAGWLGDHLHDPTLRRTLLTSDLDPASCWAVAPHLARHALGQADVAPFWLRCLAAEPALQRLACLGLAHLGDAARPHIPSLVKLLTLEEPRRVMAFHVRASAIHALGAIGPAASAHGDTIAALVGSDDPVIAAAAAWALPRLRGTEVPGPYREESTGARRSFAPADLLDLRRPGSHTLRTLPAWPASARRLALPRLLVALFDEHPSLPARTMAFGAGERTPMEMLVAVEDSAFTSLSARTIDEPERVSWQVLCGLRVEALRSVGPSVKVADNLLQWLGPRRPHLRPFADSLR